jgi:uncharacterized repeat protein (TIGR01451 family)
MGTVTPSQGTSTAFPYNLGTIASGGSATITVAYTVPSDTQAGTQTNTVSVSSDETDPDPTNNTDDDTNQVLTSADLSITKDDGVTEVTAGDGTTHTYTITVSNSGPSDADNVTVSEDSFPAGFVMGTVSSSQGDCTGFGCNLGTIASGNSATITVQYTVPSDTQAGPQTNTVSVTSDDPDPDPNNNSASDTNEVLIEIKLKISKIFAPSEVPQGNLQSFTIEVSNDGPSDAVDVLLSDLVDPLLEVTNIYINSDSADCSASNGQYIDCIVQIPTGESVTVEVDYLAAPFFDNSGSPYGTNTGDDFYFVFVNGSVLEGSTDGGPVYLNGVDITTETSIINGLTKNEIVFDPPGDDPAFTMHLSCSDPFTGGWGQSAGPVQNVDVNWQIAYFSIVRYSSQGFHKACGNVVNDFDVLNIADALGEDSNGVVSASSNTAIVTIGPGITLDRVKTKGKRLTAQLTNYTGEEKIIESISLLWPAVNGNLTEIKLTHGTISGLIWEGNLANDPNNIYPDPDANLDMNISGWTGGILQTGESTLRFNFTGKVGNSGYIIRVKFEDGTWLDINVPADGGTTSKMMKEIKVTAESMEDQETSMVIYPNPATTSFNIQLDGYKGDFAEILLFDLNGRQLLRVKEKYTPGNPLRIDLPYGLNEGLYYVKLNDGRTLKSAPLIISKMN